MSDNILLYRVLEGTEHQDISAMIRDLFSDGLPYQEQPEDCDLQKIWALGLSQRGFLSYYIGLDWLDEENSIALRVSPKISRVDYLRMFQVCLESPVASEHISETYDVRIDAAYIPQDEGMDFSIVLILHYLYTLKNLIRKPLKKGYVSRSENLSAKLKGKIQIGRHIKKNLMNLRTDRVYCTYQEYSSDCLENRILKTAFEESLQFLTRWNGGRNTAKIGLLNFERIGTTFAHIGKITHLRELKGVRNNSIYKGYAEALRLAKLILRMGGYQKESQSQRTRYIPPFIIDMSKLFELYVYHHLYLILGNRIDFQSKGKYGAVDFIDWKEKLIIDAKYKPQYKDDYYDIDNIRQISGYARDVKILKKLDVVDMERIVPCLIIYPSRTASTDFSKSYSRYADCTVNQFHQMYKLGIKLPEHI